MNVPGSPAPRPGRARRRAAATSREPARPRPARPPRRALRGGRRAPDAAPVQAWRRSGSRRRGAGARAPPAVRPPRARRTRAARCSRIARRGPHRSRLGSTPPPQSSAPRRFGRGELRPRSRETRRSALFRAAHADPPFRTHIVRLRPSCLPAIRAGRDSTAPTTRLLSVPSPLGVTKFVKQRAGRSKIDRPHELMAQVLGRPTRAASREALFDGHRRVHLGPLKAASGSELPISVHCARKSADRRSSRRPRRRAWHRRWRARYLRSSPSPPQDRCRSALQGRRPHRPRQVPVGRAPLLPPEPVALAHEVTELNEDGRALSTGCGFGPRSFEQIGRANGIARDAVPRRRARRVVARPLGPSAA